MTDWRDIAAAELRGRIAGLREAAGIVASGKYIYVADTTWSKDRSTSSVCSAGKNLVAIDIATRADELEAGKPSPAPADPA